jgi:hypothetical protein
MILVGAVLALGMGCFLFMDLALPRNVLEGRAENVRIERGFRTRERFVDIAGRSVRVTEPVYQRMKLHPVVRAEVGRGTRYVYKIDYLTN